MCGISLIYVGVKIYKFSSSKFEILKNRGPDIQNTEILAYKNGELIFHGSTLHLRGIFLTQQPLNFSISKLLWNGEIFDGIDIKDEENDGRILLNKLSFANSAEAILNIFSSIKGPWAFIYYLIGTNILWFGRDIFGRRSLVYHYNLEQKKFCLSSTALNIIDNWIELPAIGIYSLNLDNFQVTIYPWLLQSTVDNLNILSDQNTFCNLNSSLNFLQFEYNLSFQNLICPFKFEICVESSLNNCMGYRLMEKISNETCNENILNSSNILTHANEERLKLAKIFERILAEAVRIRVTTCPKFCSNCIMSNFKLNKHEIFNNGNTQDLPDLTYILNISINRCCHSKCCILFSGGIDSLVIAALSDRFIPIEEPIDLLNVMFLNDAESIPSDRTTSLEAVEELKLISPNRKWNLVQIDIEVEELQRLRKERIKNLIFPLTSVLDDSIGCALWFAARGSGFIQLDNHSKVSYTSPARVVLSGLGADEQLAGYSRHRLKYKENGINGVKDELIMELRRISSRNLGRDDRIISDHSREIRLPFLDENVVEFLASLPVHSKADLSLKRSEGEKLLLRIMAHKMGLVKGAVREKRAIQFGSGIAKLEKRKEKASHVCDRLIE